MNQATGGASALPILLLMFLTGIGIPVLASLNAGLSQRIGSPAAATAILFAIGLGISLVILLASPKPAAGAFAGVPLYFYLPATLMVFYLVSITWSAPRIGLGNAVFFVLLGQLVAAAAIDHYGWFGALRSALTLRRLAGLLVMAVGVYLARKTR